MTSMLRAICLCLLLLCAAPQARAGTAAQQQTNDATLLASAQLSPRQEHMRTAETLRAQCDPHSIVEQAGWLPLATRLIRDGFDAEHIIMLYARMGESYSPAPMARKISALYRIKFPPPAPAKSKDTGKKAPAPPPVYPGVVTSANVEKAAAFMRQHSAPLQAARQRFGIPPEVATGLLFVETRLGAYLGSAAALHNLSSLAATNSTAIMAGSLGSIDLSKADRRTWADKRTREKSDWAYEELKALLSWSQQHNLDPVAMPGSVYGAVGLCQFMPSNIPRFGADGDGNGKVNLFSVPDAVFSLSRYLSEHGWKEGISRKKQQKVLMHYNKSTRYANTILALADELRKHTQDR